MPQRLNVLRQENYKILKCLRHTSDSITSEKRLTAGILQRRGTKHDFSLFLNSKDRGPAKYHSILIRGQLIPDRFHTLNKLGRITVSQENYEILRDLGHTSDSMNDVITVILSKVRQTGGFLADSPQSAQTHAPNGGESTGYDNR